MSAVARVPEYRRLGVAWALAVAVHALLIFGIGFSSPQWRPQMMMEVTLVLHRTPKADAKADYLGAANQQGGGQTRKPVETASPRSPDFADSRINDARQERPVFSPPPDPADRKLLATRGASALKIPPVQKRPVIPQPVTGDGVPDEAAAPSAQIASLEARLAEKRQELAKMQRVRTVSTLSAREDYTAAWIDGFRQKVERFGNRNYPEDARRRHLQGEVRLLVEILPSGEVSRIRTLSSSGEMVLDEAAKRSVRMSSPFPPFSPEMRRKLDVLQVIRTWRFAEQMSNENG